MHEPPRYTARLLIGCPDRPGIVAAVSGFLYRREANIVSSHQYSTDPSGGRFFLRTEFFLEESQGWRESLQEEFQSEVAERFGMDWELRGWGERQRVAILVSRQDHCLVDLLWRWRRGELPANIVAIVSNHPDLEAEATAAEVPFHHVSFDGDAPQSAEDRLLAILEGRIDLLVLARFMRILSARVLERLSVPAINIHHSFLPAFPGADPYRRARERGVKLIGATAHYVTEELDAGPIIDQDVVRVDHRHTVRELQHLGRDVERLVLARAVALHLEDRVIADGNRTIVF